MSHWKDTFKYKLQATIIHLLLSLIVFAFIAYFVIFEWYPDGLFTADGGLSGLKLVAAIDLILGPSLTFIIFNHLKSKKEIIFDLSIIVIVQISALVWGGLQVYSQRPVALVMWEGAFYTVTENYLAEQNMTVKNLSLYSNENPLIIFAEKNYSIEQLTEVKRLNEKKIPPYAQVHLYKPIKDNMQTILSKQLPDEYLSTNVKDYKAIEEQYVFAGNAKHKKMLVSLDSKGNLLEIRAISLR